MITQWTPELKLLKAILGQAIEDMGEASHRNNAAEWIWSESVEPWSYRWVCDLLGYHCEFWRKLLERR